MAGINVLSDTLKGGNKLEKTTTQKGKDGIDSSENASDVFAAILIGSMNLIANPKGQNSSVAGKESEGTQSVGNSEPIPQNSSAQGNVLLGYGNVKVELPFFITPMLQKDFPAGKEANSGGVVNQGAGEVLTTDAQLLKAMAGLVAISPSLVKSGVVNLIEGPKVLDESLTTTGMASPKLQGDNPKITELDQYKEVIAGLLEALSGEITNTSLKGTSLGSESSGIKVLSKDMAKIVQVWLTSTDEGAKNSTVSSNQMGIKPLLDGLPTELNAKASTLVAALYPTQSQELKDTKVPQGVKETLQPESDMSDSMSKGHLETLINKPKGTENSLGPAVMAAKDTAGLSNSQQKSAQMGLQESKTPKDVQGVFNEEIHKGDLGQSSETSAVKDVQNQNSNPSIGVVSNIVATDVSDGKTASTLVWEQISTVIREQVLNRSQNLKQLDIQLHPADLGKIQIDLRWENGQVHLQVQASQAATGQLLQNQLPDLRQALANQGVNCGMLQMGQGGNQGQNPNGDESRRTFKQDINSNKDEDLSLINPPLSLEQDGINRINVTA